ncbi:alcohol dehydrogenase [Vararia minispora EC-137]|uniref:Alcohol dehydrogenase n=1 Tax=Vararia minispora EC-137 TaxID=1314806 RepID=A0ACB8QEQ2_9AGAM|nr:alcohol dehydrogenase [Vararia minispora EC-137]
MSLPELYTRFVLIDRPTTFAGDNVYRKEVLPLSNLKPGPGQALVKTLWLSLDPAMRAWMDDRPNFLPPIQIGETVRSLGVGVVLELGPDCSFKVGDLIMGFIGLRDFGIIDEATTDVIRKESYHSHTEGVVPEDYLGPMGIPGLAAYFGLYDIAHLKAGQTLVVTAAAGATGSMVCQLGKQAGAKVVAIAGTDEKCAWLRDDLGCDVVLNYKSPTFQADFEKDVDRFDIFFDNVAGPVLNYMMTRLRPNSVIVLSGFISQMNKEKPEGLTNYVRMVGMRARMEAFIITDYRERWAEGREVIAKGLADGSLKRRFEVVEGLENVPRVYNRLFSGENKGKL